MNIRERIRISPWLPAAGMLAGLLSIVAGNFGLPRPTPAAPSAQPAFNALMHWRDASHDWLLVADGRTGRLTVYNAADGQPLTGHGLRAANALVQHDGRLPITGEARPRDRF